MNLHIRKHVEHHVGNECYRNLRKTRVILHRNLVMAIVIRNIFTILVKTLITLDALTDSEDSVRNYTRYNVYEIESIIIWIPIEKIEAFRTFSPGQWRTSN